MKLTNVGYGILGLLVLLLIFLFLVEPNIILCGKGVPTLSASASADMSTNSTVINTTNTTNNMIRKEALQNLSGQLAKNWVAVTKNCVEFSKQLNIPEVERAKWSLRCMEGYSDSIPK
jgi:hypothetical protein